MPREPGAEDLPRALDEWAGAVFSVPAEGDAKSMHDAAVWIEVRTGTVLGMSPCSVDGPNVTDALYETAFAPALGPPRLPMRVRIADPLLARQLRQSIPKIEVVVAPTPELDALREEMWRHARPRIAPEAARPSALLSGDIAVEAAARFCREAAALLFRAEPWESLLADDPIGLDVPALAIDGAVVSVYGALEKQRGLTIFDSPETYNDFGAQRKSEDGPRLAMSVCYDRGADVPAGLRRELAKYAWPVADVTAFPSVALFDEDGRGLKHGPAEIALATVVAEALARFVDRHRAIIESSDRPNIRDCIAIPSEDGDIEVLISLPHPALPWPSA